MKDLEIGNIVDLPFKETGKIISIDTKKLNWFPYRIKIRKAVLNKTNQILEFKREQINGNN